MIANKITHINNSHTHIFIELAHRRKTRSLQKQFHLMQLKYFTFNTHMWCIYSVCKNINQFNLSYFTGFSSQRDIQIHARIKCMPTAQQKTHTHTHNVPIFSKILAPGLPIKIPKIITVIENGDKMRTRNGIIAIYKNIFSAKCVRKRIHRLHLIIFCMCDIGCGFRFKNI